MLIIKIHHYKQEPFLMLLNERNPIESIIKEQTYKPEVIKLLLEFKELYNEDATLLDMVEHTPFFSFYANSINYKVSNISSKNKHLFEKCSLINNVIIERETDPLQFNNFLKNKKRSAVLIIDNIKKLKYCKRPLKSGFIENIIVIGRTTIPDFDLNDVLIKNCYKKRIINDEITLYKSIYAKKDEPIIVYFD